jgi:hypothetical protein
VKFKFIFCSALLIFSVAPSWAEEDYIALFFKTSPQLEEQMNLFSFESPATKSVLSANLNSFNQQLAPSLEVYHEANNQHFQIIFGFSKRGNPEVKYLNLMLSDIAVSTATTTRQLNVEELLIPSSSSGAYLPPTKETLGTYTGGICGLLSAIHSMLFKFRCTWKDGEILENKYFWSKGLLNAVANSAGPSVKGGTAEEAISKLHQDESLWDCGTNAKIKCDKVKSFDSTEDISNLRQSLDEGHDCTLLVHKYTPGVFGTSFLEGIENGHAAHIKYITDSNEVVTTDTVNQGKGPAGGYKDVPNNYGSKQIWSINPGDPADQIKTDNKFLESLQHNRAFYLCCRKESIIDGFSRAN